MEMEIFARDAVTARIGMPSVEGSVYDSSIYNKSVHVPVRISLYGQAVGTDLENRYQSSGGPGGLDDSTE